MNVARFLVKVPVITLAFVAGLVAMPSRALAQATHSHGASVDQSNTLINVVRQSTERFKDVSVAKAEGYALMFGCVTSGDAGAMGMHFVNMSLVGDNELDPTKPEIVIYEPMPDGTLKMIGADYLVIADGWNSNPAHKAPPELMGQLFHYFEAPNRFGLPAFYTLHVWAWKKNPSGAFTNWHSDVSCSALSAQ